MGSHAANGTPVHRLHDVTFVATAFALLAALVAGVSAARLLHLIVRRVLPPDSRWIAEELVPTPWALTFANSIALGLVAPHPRLSSALGAAQIVTVGLIVIQLLHIAAVARRRRDARLDRITPAVVSVVVPFMLRVVRFSWCVLGGVVILVKLGVSVPHAGTALTIFAGGLAFAGRHFLTSVVGGIGLAITEPFRRGDRVRMTDEHGNVLEGEVVRIELYATRFRTKDETLLVIPNAHMAEMAIENLSDPRGRTDAISNIA
jgi:small-conductance mechanosensitive channel